MYTLNSIAQDECICRHKAGGFHGAGRKRAMKWQMQFIVDKGKMMQGWATGTGTSSTYVWGLNDLLPVQRCLWTIGGSLAETPEKNTAVVQKSNGISSTVTKKMETNKEKIKLPLRKSVVCPAPESTDPQPSWEDKQLPFKPVQELSFDGRVAPLIPDINH